MTVEIISCFIILISCKYWSSAKITHEYAYAAVKQHCQLLRLQTLDDYVAINSIRVEHDCKGRLRLLRLYHFEFSATGNERYNGTITLADRQTHNIQMYPYRVVQN